MNLRIVALVLTLLTGAALAVGCAPAAVEPGPTEPAGAPETDAPSTAIPESGYPGAGDEPIAAPTGIAPESGYPAGEGTPAADSPALSSGEVPQKLFDIVLDDMLTQTGADRADVLVLESVAITWPDGSLGCPEPGVMYTQALVDGYRVILGLDDETFDYHLNDNGAFVLCDIVLPDGGAPTE